MVSCEQWAGRVQETIGRFLGRRGQFLNRLRYVFVWFRNLRDVHSPHISPRVAGERNVFIGNTDHQTLLVARRPDPLLRQHCGLALPPSWGLIAVLISLFFFFLPNLFARCADLTAMLNEGVYQLKPVVRSTRGLIFSLRNESGPRTQVPRQLETPGASKRDYWHTEWRTVSFLSCSSVSRR